MSPLPRKPYCRVARTRETKTKAKNKIQIISNVSQEQLLARNELLRRKLTEKNIEIRKLKTYNEALGDTCYAFSVQKEELKARSEFNMTVFEQAAAVRISKDKEFRGIREEECKEIVVANFDGAFEGNFTDLVGKEKPIGGFNWFPRYDASIDADVSTKSDVSSVNNTTYGSDDAFTLDDEPLKENKEPSALLTVGNVVVGITDGQLKKVENTVKRERKTESVSCVYVTVVADVDTSTKSSTSKVVTVVEGPTPGVASTTFPRPVRIEQKIYTN